MKKGISPKGIASFPKLQKPDTKFNPQGVYSTKLRFLPEEAKEFLAEIQAEYEASIADAKKEVGPVKAKSLKVASSPIQPEVDKEGNETGYVLVNFKSSRKPAILDSKLKPTTADIWSGSVLKCAYSVGRWYKPAVGAGITLYLNGVQVLELMEGNGGAQGFTKEDGYEAPEAEAVMAASGGAEQEASVGGNSGSNKESAVSADDVAKGNF